MTRRATAALAFAVLMGACSGDAASTTEAAPSTTADPSTTSSAPVSTSTTATTIAPRPVAEIPSFPDDDSVIGTDDGVVIGTLDNGITYYVRSNDRPGERAQLRLAVRAGSVKEDEDQGGAAHFVEHMLFNGTEKYPANDLITVLQEFGAEFGPDINAYTSLEETVYELTVPTDREDLLPTAIEVLREWAAEALIDPEEVDLERGVLIEEWRLRSQGFAGRYYDGVVERLLAGTAYEGQNTLADPDAVASTTAEALRRFYEDWYRPDNLAVVAVGDFDVAEVERLIAEVFGGLPAREGPPVPEPTTAPATEPSYFVLADPEFRQAFVELNYPLPSLEPGTVGSLRRSTAFGLAWDMIVSRLEEDSLAGAAPFYSPGFAANPLVRTQRSPGLAAFADPSDLAATAEALLSEVERVLIHGFDVGELDRAIDEARAEVDLDLQRSGTTQDAAYADGYVEHFLGDAPIPAADEWAALRNRLLDEMTLAQVTDTFRAEVQSTEPLVIAVAPEDDAGLLPTEADLAGILERVRAADLPVRVDAVEDIEALMETPDPTDFPELTMLPGTQVEVATLANGVRVILLPTQIVENVVFVGGTSFGGWSLLPPEDAAEARLAASIVTRSGVAGFSQAALERYLSDRVAFAAPYIDETAEGFFGTASTEDLETLFQLIYLYATEPQVTEVGERLVLEELRPVAEDPTTDPQLALALEVADARFGGDPRFLPIPSPEDLATFDADRALEIYRERFADFSEFVFVVSGDIDEDAGLLVLRYLGSLPSAGVDETYADVRIPRPPGVVERTVRSGSGEFGQLTLLWDLPLPLDPQRRVEAELLELVLRQRLTDRIREELSATYSPAVGVTIVEDPVPSIELRISISADPADLDTVVAEVLADLADLREAGPTAEQVAIAQEQRTRDLELVSNESLIDTLTFYLLRPDEDPGEIFAEAARVEAATAADLQSLARDLVDADDYILVKLIPEAG